MLVSERYQGSEWGQSEIYKVHIDIHEFKCLHIYMVGEILHITRKSLTWYESFNKCNCKKWDKRVLWAYFRSNDCWVNLMWTFFACTWHQKSFRSTNRSSPVAQPSSFRFWQWHYIAVVFYSPTSNDPSSIYYINVIHLLFSCICLLAFEASHCKMRLLKGSSCPLTMSIRNHIQVKNCLWRKS